METIHERIRQKRMAKNLSMAELAKICDVSWQTVQLWEKTTAPKRARLQKVAEALGTSADYLLWGEKAPADGVQEALTAHSNLPGEIQALVGRLLLHAGDELLITTINALLDLADRNWRSKPGYTLDRPPTGPQMHEVGSKKMGRKINGA